MLLAFQMGEFFLYPQQQLGVNGGSTPAGAFCDGRGYIVLALFVFLR